MSKDRARLESEAPTIGQSAGTAPTLLKVERSQFTGDTAACPDENEITALIQGLLPEDSVRSLEEHLDGCAHCAAVVAELGVLLAPADPANESAQHQQIDRYQVLRPLGAGGMGVVSLAYDPRLKRNIALKLLRPELRDSPDGTEARRRMLREGQALAALSHPNVMTVHDVGSWDGGVFIAMEFVQGATLTDWIGEQSPGWREVLQVFLQAGRGLEAAHGVGLVHRDVKPSNILLGADGRVRVTDFGLATASEARATLEELKGASPAAESDESITAADALTRTGALLGTPAYMSPEQLDGRRADARSDQFSFCVSLYEALSGRRPFRGGTMLELAESVNQDPVSETGLTGVPRSIRAALLRGLRPRPVDRFDSMTSLLGELERSGDESPARAAPRIRLSTLLSATALVVALSAVALWLFLRPPGRNESGPPAQPASAPVAARVSVPIQPQAQPVPSEPSRTKPAPPAVMRVLPRRRVVTPRRRVVTPRRRVVTPRRRVVTPPANRARPSYVRGFVDPRVAAALKKAKVFQRIFALRMQVRRLSSKGQGKPCLAALAELKRLAPVAARRMLYYRAICSMSAGYCARGKRLFRQHLKSVSNLTPANVTASIKVEAARRCP